MSFEKIFCWVVCLFFMAMPAMSVSFTIGDFKYDVTDTTGLTVSVSAASDTISGKVTIPDKIEYEGKEYSVTAIGEGAFKKCAGLTSVIIPNTVASIGKDALHVDTVCCLTESDTIRIIRDTLFIHNLQEFISYKILAAKGVYMNAILEADIDLSSVCGVINGERVSWTPIRMSGGSFDGGNHTISNLYINQPNDMDGVALFRNGKSLYDLQIKNLKVTNAYVKGGSQAAGIAIHGIFVNCHFEGVVIGQYAGGVNEYGKPSMAYNCSNYGLIVSSNYSIGVAADQLLNCYNRGRIVSDKAAVGLGMYDGYHFNLYNAGEVYTPDLSSIYYIETSGFKGRYGNLFVLQQMDSIAFLSGAVKDSLNMYVSQNPKEYCYDRDSVPLLSWVQGEDGFPRFEGVDLQPTQGYVVHFKGAINDYEVSLDGTIALPVCSVKGRSYVFSDNFDGKNIVSDTVVTVEMIGEAKKDSIWGLDMSDIANIDTSGYITLSFYSNVERERVYGIEGDFFYNIELSSYFYTNTYSSKAGVTCDYVQENDSVYKITLHNVYFYSQDDSLLIWMDVEHYNQKSNILKWEKKDTTQSLPVSGQIAGHDYIDLGLPSGTLWATYNVGATKPTEYGDYFAWGETEPKEVYDWNTYKYAKASFTDNFLEKWQLDSLTKYNSGKKYPGAIDNLTSLLPEDDAATANWGEKWRMPTKEEQEELYKNCYVVWTDNYNGTDVFGVIFYKAKEESDKGQFIAPWNEDSSLSYNESSDIHIFLPATGYRNDSTIKEVDYSGSYWSSSLYVVNDNQASYLYCREKTVEFNVINKRNNGYPVRAVVNKVSNIEKYVVSFYTKDSVLIESQNVEEGKSATPVEAPALDGFEFIGWSDTSFTNVTKDLDIYAQYKEIIKDTFTVSGEIAGHGYVDFDLPSGTLWATYNVGATKPTEYGDYFAWGETEPKDVYDWNTYKYCTAYLNEFDLWKLQSITKYNFGNEYTGTIDNQSILLSEDDAATANWGKEWVMPTIDDLKELSSECYIVWTNDYSGAKGIIVYKAKRAEDKGQRVESTQSPSTDYSIADAHIFLPAQGFREGLDVLNVGSEGGYWLSSLDEKKESHSYLYLFSNENGYWEGYVSNRYLGCPVRAVSKPEASEVSDIISQALQVYVANGTIYVVDAQPNAKIQVFEMNGKIVASGTTDANGSAEIKQSVSKGVYVVTDGNQSTKVVIK